MHQNYTVAKLGQVRRGGAQNVLKNHKRGEPGSNFGQKTGKFTLRVHNFRAKKGQFTLLRIKIGGLGHRGP